jgi:hypothetical protein
LEGQGVFASAVIVVTAAIVVSKAIALRMPVKLHASPRIGQRNESMPGYPRVSFGMHFKHAVTCWTEVTASSAIQRSLAYSRKSSTQANTDQT